MGDDSDEFSERERKALKQVANGVIDQWPSRRQALKYGMTAFAAGGLGAAGGVGHAQAQTEADGQVGTEDDPVDVKGSSISATEVNGGVVVGDDSNQYSSIQAAHDALPSEGGVVEVVDNVAETDATFSKTVVKLIGAGSGGLFDRDTAATIDASGGNGLVLTDTADAVVLEDVEIIGDGSADSIGVDTPSGSSIDSIHFRNVSVDGFETNVRLRRVNHWRGTPLYVTDAVDDGLLCTGSVSGDFVNAGAGQLVTENNGRDGVRIDFSTGTSFRGNQIWLSSENNGGWGVNHVGGSMDDNRFRGYGTESNSSGSMNFSSGHLQTVLTCRTVEGGPSVSAGAVAQFIGAEILVHGNTGFNIPNLDIGDDAAPLALTVGGEPDSSSAMAVLNNSGVTNNILEAFQNNGTKVMELDNDGNINIAGTVSENQTF